MTTVSTVSPSPGLAHAIASYEAPRLFLAAASIGLPTRETVDALRRDLELWSAARRDPMQYDQIIANTRASYAQLVGVASDRVAIGSQSSAITSVLAAAVPEGAEVLCVEGDFSSIVFPFLQRNGIVVRSVPLAELAAEITDATWLVVFSHVQSATGGVADVAAIVSAAREHDAYSYCDTTQSAGVHPVDAALFDATVCHSYKWLCAPRGVAFLTVGERFERELTPIQAGWYSGDAVWQSCYGPSMALALDARKFDLSPAWPAWVGAEPSIRMFSELDIDEVWARASGLGDLLCERLGMEPQHQAIVTWADPDGDDLARLMAAGIKVSGRAGRLRAAFHLWNDETDVDAVVATLGRA